ncbi:tRNA(Ile)-lysidine synthase [subsurface metagenome]
MVKYCKFFRECKSKAVYRIPHSNLALCKDHFLANVEKRVQKLVQKSHIIRREGKNKILIALSGGKDSQVLLSIMKKLYPENIELHGLYIELGISDENYSKDSGIIAQSLCDKLDLPFHKIDIKQQNGFNIDDIHNLKQKIKKNKQKSTDDQIRGECSYCGLLKRYHINKFAVDNDFSVVLTGHNLTDEATSLVNNFFNVDIGFLKKPGNFLENLNMKNIRALDTTTPNKIIAVNPRDLGRSSPSSSPSGSSSSSSNVYWMTDCELIAKRKTPKIIKNQIRAN